MTKKLLRCLRSCFFFSSKKPYTILTQKKCFNHLEFPIKKMEENFKFKSNQRIFLNENFETNKSNKSYHIWGKI